MAKIKGQETLVVAHYGSKALKFLETGVLTYETFKSVNLEFEILNCNFQNLDIQNRELYIVNTTIAPKVFKIDSYNKRK